MHSQLIFIPDWSFIFIPGWYFIFPQILSIVQVIAYIFEKHGWVELLGNHETKISPVYESLDYSSISSMLLTNKVTFRRKKKIENTSIIL